MKTIAIDFDGVIHRYSKGWHDGTIYDIPNSGAFDFIRKTLEKGDSLFIHSSRDSVKILKWLVEDYSIGYTCEIIHERVKFWNKRNIIGITNRKLPAHVYIDDRAITFKGNFDILSQEVDNFKTYQDK